MRLSIYSLGGTIFAGEAEKLTCRTATGEITVLDQHVPLITTLAGPAVKISMRGGEGREIPVTSGFLEVRPKSEVVMLLDPAREEPHRKNE